MDTLININLIKLFKILEAENEKEFEKLLYKELRKSLYQTGHRHKEE